MSELSKLGPSSLFIRSEVEKPVRFCAPTPAHIALTAPTHSYPVKPTSNAREPQTAGALRRYS
jgi:hypothetical protein